MIDPREHWMPAWRNIDQDRADPIDAASAALTSLGLAALIVVPITIVRLQWDRELFAWIASVL